MGRRGLKRLRIVLAQIPRGLIVARARSAYADLQFVPDSRVFCTDGAQPKFVHGILGRRPWAWKKRSSCCICWLMTPTDRDVRRSTETTRPGTEAVRRRDPDHGDLRRTAGPSR